MTIRYPLVFGVGEGAPRPLAKSPSPCGALAGGQGCGGRAFERRLLKIIYCTETFAVGLNFPCRTVCFESLTKWMEVQPGQSGVFQMAGRRRGLTRKASCFPRSTSNTFNPRSPPSGGCEPSAAVALSYNSVLNLVRKYDEEEINRILQQNCQLPKPARTPSGRGPWSHQGQVGQRKILWPGGVGCPGRPPAGQEAGRPAKGDGSRGRRGGSPAASLAQAGHRPTKAPPGPAKCSPKQG